VRIRLPSSHVFTRFRFSPLDVIWAAMSPMLALYLSSAYILTDGDVSHTGSYCLISLTISLFAFAVFRVHVGLPRYLSARDVTALAQAVAVGELMTCVVLFGLTRLDGIPRSTPAIHALLLWAGLVAVRGLANIADRGRKLAQGSRIGPREHLILIGLNDLSAFFIRFLESVADGRQRVIAVLDPDTRWIGRAVHRVPVLGQPAHLDAIVEEFATHGVRTDRIVVAGAPDMFGGRAMEEVRSVCAQRDLDLEFLPQLFRTGGSERARSAAAPDSTIDSAAPALVPSPYFTVKQVIDFAVALVLIVASALLWTPAALLIWLFVGSPILFWQQRVGRGGSEFDLQKLRTLRPSVDQQGQRVREADRLSWIGRILRYTRVDELPQLLNVLAGEMSVVGPRPLLPRDQPQSPARRLLVRPGITGWAQVNGGNLLSAEEKQVLDEWYIRNASLWLDLRIVAMTPFRMIGGDRRRERALAQAAMPVAGRGRREAMRPSAAALGD
jgi:lipopolysaccharide/colanic/teichoic acid biosynthesis glycosyltransferase